MISDSFPSSGTQADPDRVEQRLAVYIKQVQRQTKSPDCQYVTARLLKRLKYSR